MNQEKNTDANQEINIEPIEIEQEPKKKKLWIWILIVLLLLAIGITAALLGSRLSEQVEGEDVISLLPEDGDDVTEGDAGDLAASDQNSASGGTAGGASDGSETSSSVKRAGGTVKTLHASMVTEDKNRVWSTMTHVDIFDDYYYGTYKAGTKHKVTVENDSDDGMNLIAPGTENSYTFWIKNTGDVPMDYQLSFESRQNYDYGIPIEFRLKSGDTYIFGDGANWESWEDLNKAGEGKRLEPKNYARYTLEWRWKFRGENEHDTYLGNKAKYQDIRQDVVIYTTGTVSEGYSEAMLLGRVQTGDDSNWLLWIILIIVSLTAIIGYIKWKKGSRKDEEE